MQRKRRGRNEGSDFQRTDGTWTASISLGYDDAGKRKRRTVYGATKAEVQGKLRELQNSAADGHVPELHKLTVGEHLRGWRRSSQPSPTTRTCPTSNIAICT